MLGGHDPRHSEAPVMSRFATGVTVVTTTAQPARSVDRQRLQLRLARPAARARLPARGQRDARRPARLPARSPSTCSPRTSGDLADRFATASDAQWAGVAHELAADRPPAARRHARHARVRRSTSEAHGGDHRIVIGRVLALLARASRLPRCCSPARATTGSARPSRGPETDLPSRLGDLEWPCASGATAVSMVATVGEPRAGAALYVHRGCIVGDLLDSAAGAAAHCTPRCA